MLTKTSGKPVASVAKDLGLSSSTMYGWLNREKEAEGTRAAELNNSESVRVRQLQKELEEVKIERDILKKVVAIFSKQPR